MNRPLILASSVIEFLAALAVLSAVGKALVIAVRDRFPRRARLAVAQGVVTALSFALAATLLKALGLTSWMRIGMFACVLALRVAVKRLFAWEAARLA